MAFVFFFSRNILGRCVLLDCCANNELFANSGKESSASNQFVWPIVDNLSSLHETEIDWTRIQSAAHSVWHSKTFRINRKMNELTRLNCCLYVASLAILEAKVYDFWSPNVQCNLYLDKLYFPLYLWMKFTNKFKIEITFLFFFLSIFKNS